MFSWMPFVYWVLMKRTLELSLAIDQDTFSLMILLILDKVTENAKELRGCWFLLSGVSLRDGVKWFHIISFENYSKVVIRKKSVDSRSEKPHREASGSLQPFAMATLLIADFQTILKQQKLTLLSSLMFSSSFIIFQLKETLHKGHHRCTCSSLNYGKSATSGCTILGSSTNSTGSTMVQKSSHLSHKVAKTPGRSQIAHWISASSGQKKALVRYQPPRRGKM